MKNKQQILSVLTGLMVSLSVMADPAADLDSELKNMHALQANFNQVVKAGKKEVSRSSGDMLLEKPGHFRWRTREPMAQWVIADGQKLWVYDVDLEQVTVKPQGKHFTGTPALFLSADVASVLRDFNVKKTTKQDESCYDLSARAEDESYQRVRLTFTHDHLSQIELFDKLGQHTTVSLNHVVYNPPIQAASFQFKPPKGVDIIEQ